MNTVHFLLHLQQEVGEILLDRISWTGDLKVTLSSFCYFCWGFFCFGYFVVEFCVVFFLRERCKLEVAAL